MRITGGRFGGRRVKAPAGRQVRPTQDRVRESLFGQLGPDLSGVACLDLFAGSGIVGLEAVSRGARWVTFVERSRQVAAGLRQNAQQFGVTEQVEIVVEDAGRYLSRRGWQDRLFDLVFLDPPYGQGLAARMVKSVDGARCTVPGGLVVVEHERGLQLPARCGSLQHVRTRSYGSTCLTFYRADEEGEE